MTLRVATTALANRIYAGHPCKDGLGFKAGRVDVTSDVLKAIGEFVGVGNEVTVECEGEPKFRIAVIAASVGTHPKDGEPQCK